ncbi:MAG: 2-oxoacid:acceptor oxidoreductase family protein [Promethearchaeota archaeon]
MGDIFNILIAGVGGQGVVRLGNILRDYGLISPLIKNVVGTETRGVSQREGSVTATARYLIDGRVYSLDQGYEYNDLISPVIPMNDAHLVLGLEPLETLRNLKLISEQTVVILNTHNHYPRDVIIGTKGGISYPSNAKILDLLDQFARKVVATNFHELAEIKFNNAIYANTILLGTAVKEFREIFLKEKIRETVENYFRSSKENLEAFELGYSLISNG